MKNIKRLLSVLLVVVMMAAMFVPALAADVESSVTVSSDGPNVTVSGLTADVKDIWIGLGEYNTYRDVKNNAVVQITGAKINGASEYTYLVKEGGMHTVLVRYNDGTQVFAYEEVKVTEPTFTLNGLQLTVGNIDNVKVIRTAYGTYTKVSDLKKADTHRGFTAKNEIKGADTYKIQYRDNGTVTVAVQYNDGYTKIVTQEIEQKVPTFVQDGNKVTIGDLDDLYVIRYAPGEYSNVGDIKRAPGAKYFKAKDINENGYIVVDNLADGTYTFCVQYADESFNYYVITVGEVAPVLGSYENPYLINVGDSRFVVYLPAGEGAYVKASDSNGSVLTVGYATTPNYNISYLPGQYVEVAEDGSASFNMIAEKDFFYIANTGDEAVTIYMALEAGAAVDTTGTWDNPEVITLTEQFGALRAFSTKDLAAGNQGYYYTVTAPADGKLGFNVSAKDAEFNDMGWQFFYIKNGAVYSDTYTSIDYAYETIFADVVAGDEITLVVATFDANDPWNNPAATINVNVAFVENGSSDAPFTADAGAQTTDVKAGSEGVYYTYTATEPGVVNVIMYSESWVYVVNNLTSYVYGDTQWSDSDPVVPMTTVEVAEGDELQIMVNTYDPANPWSAPAGTVSWELEFVAGEGEGEEPEEAELGSYENPYIINAGDTRVAAYVPAGETVYVKAIDCNNATFTLGYATAPTYEIWYLRQQYLPNTESGNNDTTFTMVSDVDTFGITNTGEEAINVYMALEAGAAVDNSGTWDNPEVVTLTEQFGALRAWSEVELAAGNQGRWYKVVAPMDGKLAINVNASDAEWNAVGWQFNYTIGYAQSDLYTSEEYAYETIFVDVVAGDEIIISASTFDPEDVWNNPAGTLSLNLGFAEYGSADAPFTAEAGAQTTDVKAGSQGVYYTYVAPAAGTVEVAMNSESWTYVVNNFTAFVYGDTQWSDSDPVVSVTSIEVAEGDELQIMVNTYDPADEWNAPAGTVEWTLTFTEAAAAPVYPERDYTITFDPNGGVMPAGTVNVLPINNGQNYKEAAGYDYPVPTLEGYNFAGWYWEEYNFTLTEGDWNGGNYAITWSIDVVALWEEA